MRLVGKKQARERGDLNSNMPYGQLGFLTDAPWLGWENCSPFKEDGVYNLFPVVSPVNRVLY